MKEDGFFCVIVAVKWDEVIGPQIISVYPEGKLQDPNAVALQLYFSLIAMTGQDQLSSAEGTDLTVPLTSLGTNYIARVAFGYWDDKEVRGGKRPFYLALIMHKKTAEILDGHLNIYMQEYLEQLRVLGDDFDGSHIYKILQEYYYETEFIPEKIPEDALYATMELEYSVRDALQDLRDLTLTWLNTKDTTVKDKLIKASKRLENIEPDQAATGWYITAEIFQELKEYEKALQLYQRSAKLFLRKDKTERAADAFFQAGKVARMIQRWDIAKKMFLAAEDWATDPELKVDIYISLAEIEVYPMGNLYSAIDTLEKGVFHIKPKESPSSFLKLSKMYISLLDDVLTKNPNLDWVQKNTLLEKKANLYSQSATAFSELNMKEDAAKSLSLSAKEHLTLKNFTKAFDHLEKALEYAKIARNGTLIMSIGIEFLTVLKKYRQELPTTQIKELIDIFEKYLDDPLVAIVTGDEAKTFQYAVFLMEIGFLLYDANMRERSLRRFEQACNLLEKITLDSLSKDELQKKKLTPSSIIKAKIHALTNIANLYFYMEYYPIATRKFQEILDIMKTIEDKNLFANEMKSIQKNVIISNNHTADSYYGSFLTHCWKNQLSDALEDLKRWFQYKKLTIEVAKQIDKETYRKNLEKIGETLKRIKEKELQFMSSAYDLKFKDLVEDIENWLRKEGEEFYKSA